MFNLIKMDLYRMIHSVSFKVMLFVVAAVAFFTIGMTSYDVKNTQGQIEDTVPQVEQQDDGRAQVSEDGAKVVLEIGFTMDTDYGWGTEAPFSEIMNENFKSRILLLLCVIFVPIFVHAEYKNGYIKNIAGQLPNRGVLAASKLVAVAVQVLIIFAGYLFFSAIAGKIFFGDAMVFKNIGDLLRYTVLHYIMHLAVSYIVLMLTILARGSALPLTYGILCSTTFTALLYSGINMLVSVVTGKNTFDIGLYTPEMNVMYITADMSSEVLIRVLLVGGIYALATAVLSIVIMKKRDI